MISGRQCGVRLRAPMSVVPSLRARCGAPSVVLPLLVRSGANARLAPGPTQVVRLTTLASDHRVRPENKHQRRRQPPLRIVASERALFTHAVGALGQRRTCSSCSCGLTGHDSDDHEDNDWQRERLRATDLRDRRDASLPVGARSPPAANRLPGSSGGGGDSRDSDACRVVGAPVDGSDDNDARERSAARGGSTEFLQKPLAPLFAGRLADADAEWIARLAVRENPVQATRKLAHHFTAADHFRERLAGTRRCVCETNLSLLAAPSQCVAAQSYSSSPGHCRRGTDGAPSGDLSKAWRRHADEDRWASARAPLSTRPAVMVKRHDPNEGRSVVHIVKSPSSRSQQSEQSPRPVVTVVDEEQLHRRLLQSISERGASAASQAQQQSQSQPQTQQQAPPQSQSQQQPAAVVASQQRRTRKVSPESRAARGERDRDRSVSSSSSSSRSDSRNGPILGHTRPVTSVLASAADNEPPPSAIIIPPSVAESYSMRRQQQLQQQQQQQQPHASGGRESARDSQGSAITREQLEYGPLLRSNEVQVLYRSPDSFNSSLGLGSVTSVSSSGSSAPGSDRQKSLRDEQLRQVAPNMRQSPISLMSMNPAYEQHTKALVLDYPATVENLRLNNTGFSWEVKIPFQISMSTALYGAHLAPQHRFRLDQFHCHWGDSGEQGSEHTIDSRHYSAEMHFVHYNMEKYHTMSKAARHPDGLVVMSVLIEAQPNYHNHAELEKIVTNLKSIQLKGEHSYIRQVLRIENLLPANRSYWSYAGSLTTPPYLESVTWFVLKQPIKCNSAQLERFRSIKSTIRHDDDDQSTFIRSNFRKTQPLNGRTIITYDEPSSGAGSAG